MKLLSGKTISSMKNSVLCVEMFPNVDDLLAHLDLRYGNPVDIMKGLMQRHREIKLIPEVRTNNDYADVLPSVVKHLRVISSAEDLVKAKGDNVINEKYIVCILSILDPSVHKQFSTQCLGTAIERFNCLKDTLLKLKEECANMSAIFSSSLTNKPRCKPVSKKKANIPMKHKGIPESSAMLSPEPHSSRDSKGQNEQSEDQESEYQQHISSQTPKTEATLCPPKAASECPVIKEKDEEVEECITPHEEMISHVMHAHITIIMHRLLIMLIMMPKSALASFSKRIYKILPSYFEIEMNHPNCHLQAQPPNVFQKTLQPRKCVYRNRKNI